MAKSPLLPCKLCSGTRIQVVVFTHLHVNNMSGQMEQYLIKVSAAWRAWEERFVMERYWEGIPTACWWGRPVGLPAHTQMDDVSRESHAHTHRSAAPFAASSERKWDWTRRGRVGEGVNHLTNAALHHRFPLTATIVCTAPPSPSFSYTTVD